MAQIVPEEFSRKVTVAGYEVCAQGDLRMSVFLRMCQETSDQHLTALDLEYEKLWNDGIVFLIMTNCVTIHEMPKHGDTLTIVTRPRGTHGVQFYRDFTFYKDGKPMVYVMQSSVSTSTEHKILRPKRFLEYGIFSGEKLPDGEQLERLKLPDTMEHMGARQVRYSDLDCNQHLNNALYADILLDFLPGGAYGKQVRGMQIDYLNESTLGETLEVYARGGEGGEVLLRGDNARGVGFAGKLVLKKRE